MAGRPDIALVSLGTTLGLRRADEALARQIEAAGAACTLVPVHIGASARLRRTMALTDLVESLAARRAAREASAARAVIVSSVTAALLAPRPGRVAVRFDGIAAVNRPGAGGAWQRRRERTVLGRADLLLPWSEPARAAAVMAVGPGAPPAVVLPPPVERAALQAGGEGRPYAVAYAGNPDKRGLDLLCRAWVAVAPEPVQLVIGGLDREEGLAWLARRGVQEPAGVIFSGTLEPERWRALVAGARAFVSASRIEDWGLAQMEALAAGVPLVTVPSPGANAALPLARDLAPELVAAERTPAALALALSAGLALDDAARGRYAERAAAFLKPYREESLVQIVADEVLPALLAPSSS